MLQSGLFAKMVPHSCRCWRPKWEVGGESELVSKEKEREVFHLGTKRLFQKSGRGKLLQLLMSVHSFPSGAVYKKYRDSQSAWEKGKENFNIYKIYPKNSKRLGLWYIYTQPCAADYGLHSIRKSKSIKSNARLTTAPFVSMYTNILFMNPCT